MKNRFIWKTDFLLSCNVGRPLILEVFPSSLSLLPLHSRIVDPENCLIGTNWMISQKSISAN